MTTCQRITGHTHDLNHLAPERRGQPRPDGRFHVLCGLFARWEVWSDSPTRRTSGRVACCSLCLSAVAENLGGDVRVVKLGV